MGGLADVREHCLQEISVVQVVGLPRTIGSRGHHKKRRTVIAECTRGYNRLRLGVVFGTHEHSNLLARLDFRDADAVRLVSKVKGACR